MTLPKADSAQISRAKIVDYLLSPTHRSGKFKAAVFTRCGFRREQWELLADALRRHAAEHPVTQQAASPFGVRFVIDGSLRTPAGPLLNIRAVWFMDTVESEPRFVTAYPTGRSR